MAKCGLVIKMKKIEELMEELKTTILKYHDAKDFSSRLYWLKQVFKKSEELNGMIAEELKLDD